MVPSARPRRGGDQGLQSRHGSSPLPSGHEAVNRTWMWAAFLAFNCSAWLQSLAGVDIGPTDERTASGSAVS